MNLRLPYEYVVPRHYRRRRLCRLTDLHQTLTFSYTPHGELASQTPVIGGASYGHSFRHDDLGRLDRITYPDNVIVDYTWAHGRVTAVSATLNGQTPIPS